MADGMTTTFIPKRIDSVATGIPSASNSSTGRTTPTGLLNIIAGLIFIVALLSSGGVYLYKSYLTKNIADMKATIERAEKAFEPSLILELVRLDTRLKVSSQLLTKHTVFSPLFRSIEQATLPEVSFNAFQFEYEEGIPQVQMKGIATRYTPIAQQSTVLGQNNLIVDHIFSNFALTQTGRVSFDLNFALNPSLMLYTSQAAGTNQVIQ